MSSPQTATADSRLVALVVDDDVSIRRLCRTILEKEGLTVHEASDGEEGVALARRHIPDIIIVDMLMPNLDGLEVTRRLRADASTEAIPIIIISVLGDSSDIVAGLEAGADEYLAKPLNAKELAVRVRSMTRLYQAWREQERGYGLLGEHARSLGLLLDFSGILTRTEELDTILDKTIEVAATLTSCRRISIMLPDSRGETLRIARSVGLADSVAGETLLPVSSTLAERVFASRKQVVCNTEEEAVALAMAYGTSLMTDMPSRPLPMMSVAMSATERTVGVLNVTDRIGHRPFSSQELEYLNLVSNYAASAIQSILTRQAREEARDSIVVALAKLAEHRDDDTGKHLERVTLFCHILAKKLREEAKYEDAIDGEFLRNLQRAAPLHDIGKVAIPDLILLKPGKLTPDEMAVMRTHAAAGAETIRSLLDRTPDSGFLKMAEAIAIGHHEWFNGTGYPQCVSGEQIPLPARILALADVYDALTTKRVYKDAISHEKAAEIIREHCGTQFHPDIVEAFNRCEGEFLRLATELADRAPETKAKGESVGAGRDAGRALAHQA